MSDDATGFSSDRPDAPRWSRLASVGLLLAAVGPILMLVAGIAWGLSVGDELPFFLTTAALFAIGAFLIRRWPTWQSVLGIVAGLLGGLALFWTAFSLTVPDSFFDFIPGVLVMPGLFVGIVAGVASILSRRRADVATPAAGERRAIGVVLAVVAVAVVLSGIATLAGQESVDDPSSASATVRMSDFEFAQERYQLEAGSQVLVVNDDPFLHTFTVDELGIDVSLSPGSEKLVDIPDEPGDYVLYCEPHTSDPDDPAEDDMAASLEVG